MRALVQAIWVVLGGSVLGLGLNATSRHPVQLGAAVYPASASGGGTCSAAPAHPAIGRHPTIRRDEAVAACSACTVGFVDARSAHDFAEGHVPGAVHLPPAGHPDEAQALSSLRRYGEVVIYDQGADCDFAPGVADRLQAAGLRVRVLEGGWSGWQAVSGPAQSGACQACAGAAVTSSGAGQ